VGEHERVARLQARLDLLAVELGLAGVGGQDHHDVGAGGRVLHVAHGQPLGLGLGPRAAVRRQADFDLHPAVAQVEGVGVALAAVPDDGDALPLQLVEVRVGVVVDPCHLRQSSQSVLESIGLSPGISGLSPEF
jgi:hypothetical protein